MKNILLVGASASIGAAVIARFRSGATRIAATYCAHACIRPDESVHPLFLDLADEKSIDDFVRELKQLMTHIDTAIFLAGVISGKSLEEYESNEIDRVMAINFSGQAKTIKKLLPLFSTGSQMIFMSSISAQKGSHDPVYAASKGAILSFAKSLASTAAPRIRVYAVAPGLIKDSYMYQSMAAERRDLHLSRIPNEEFLNITDLADILYDLSQDHWAHLNGACIDLNGGQYVR